MYQFRFVGNESEISNIFKDCEISEAFEKVFISKNTILLERIKEYKEFILSKNIPNFSKSSLLEDKILLTFKEDLKRHILYIAIADAFSGKLNVKENILEILQETYIEKFIMGHMLLYSFRGYLVVNKSSSVYYIDTIEDLESEFLQKK